MSGVRVWMQVGRTMLTVLAGMVTWAFVTPSRMMCSVVRNVPSGAGVEDGRRVVASRAMRVCDGAVVEGMARARAVVVKRRWRRSMMTERNLDNCKKKDELSVTAS